MLESIPKFDEKDRIISLFPLPLGSRGPCHLFHFLPDPPVLSPLLGGPRKASGPLAGNGLGKYPHPVKPSLAGKNRGP